MLTLKFYEKRYKNSNSRDSGPLFSRLWQFNTDAIAERYDHELHQTLIKIFRERCSNSSDQIRDYICGSKHNTDQKFKIKQILEQLPLNAFKKLSLLWISVIGGYKKSAELLMRSGANVNELFGRRDPQVINEKWTVLHVLLQIDASPEVKRLVRLVADHGADLQARDNEGETPLHYAVRGGQAEMIEILLEKGADINVVNNYGETPMLVAVSINKANKLVPLLMKHGVDVFVKDHLGMNALHRLALLKPVKDAPTEVARVFIEKGVSLDDKLVDGHYQPLHLAALNGNNEIVKLFLDHGANVNALNEYDESPLYLAAAYEKPKVLETLIKCDANVHLKTSEGCTALHAVCEYAAWSGLDFPDDTDAMEGMISLLLSAGANVLDEDSNGLTPLAHITLYGKVDEPEIQLIVKMLVLKKVLQPSIELKDERIIEQYQKLQGYYRDCIQETDKMKITRFIDTCSFFKLLTKNHRQIAKLMRNSNFETQFVQYDLNEFPNYAIDIRRAFERAQKHFRAMLEQENVINEAVYNILPYLVVKKVVHYIFDD